jgi:hypothetical protein
VCTCCIVIWSQWLGVQGSWAKHFPCTTFPAPRATKAILDILALREFRVACSYYRTRLHNGLVWLVMVSVSPPSVILACTCGRVCICNSNPHTVELQVKLSLYTSCRRQGERKYSSYTLLTSALDGGEWLASRPGRALPPGKDPRYPLDRLAGPQIWFRHRCLGKVLCLCRGSNPGRPVCSQTRYWLSYPISYSWRIRITSRSCCWCHLWEDLTALAGSHRGWWLRNLKHFNLRKIFINMLYLHLLHFYAVKI